MKIQGNQKEGFINFWEFLEIPMNSPIGDIKLAFVSKFEKIDSSIKRGESNYSLEDLKTCISAYETLSDPHSRLLHNCEIDGEEPPKGSDWDFYCSEYTEGTSDDDLFEDRNQEFLAWLLSKANELNVQIELFMEIVKMLYELSIKESEKQSNKKKQELKMSL